MKNLLMDRRKLKKSRLLLRTHFKKLVIITIFYYDISNSFLARTKFTERRKSLSTVCILHLRSISTVLTDSVGFLLVPSSEKSFGDNRKHSHCRRTSKSCGSTQGQCSLFPPSGQIVECLQIGINCISTSKY